MDKHKIEAGRQRKNSYTYRAMRIFINQIFQLTGTGHSAEQVAAHIDAPPTRTFSPMRQATFLETRSPRGCTPESTRALTRLRGQKYRNRLHRLRIPPILPPREWLLRHHDQLPIPVHRRNIRFVSVDEPFSGKSTNLPGMLMRRFFATFLGPINPAAGRNHETLGSFIEALRR